MSLKHQMSLPRLRPSGDNCILPHPMSPAAPPRSGPAGDYNSRRSLWRGDYNSRRSLWRGDYNSQRSLWRGDYNSRRSPWRRDSACPVWRALRACSGALSPGRAGPARRGPQPTPPPAAAGPAQEIPSPKSFQPNGASEEALRCEIKELKQKDLALDQEIAQLLSEGYSLEELDKHISLLHEYNEIKDAGQMLLGKLAVIRGVTTKQLYPEYDLELSD
ncbi:DNA repair protein SWI5 homolog [Taeniopygia guttata]|uniref:DNA repair protein SWI5 homolog n=1 Tax=Taeniopygia guttata TaxID=59729 RepID=UPI003BB872DA